MNKPDAAKSPIHNGGTISEEQVLPEFIATLKAAAERATPGPWSASAYSGNLGTLVSFGNCAKGENIAAVVAQRNPQQGIANGKLIAAASPENILKLLASLAQSEAERERLQGDRKEAEMVREEYRYRVEEWLKRDSEKIATLTAALARERERNQDLRQVVTQYHEQCYHCFEGIACEVCVLAKPLLEPAPVVTGEETGK